MSEIMKIIDERERAKSKDRKNFKMSQKDSVNPKPFYPNSYLLSTIFHF